MSIDWDDGGMQSRLHDLAAAVDDLKDDAFAGAAPVLVEAQSLAPKKSGDLVGSSKVVHDRGGNDTVGVIFPGPYARYIHEHLHFKHPGGGQAKFLEQAMLTKGDEFTRRAGEHFWERL